MVIWGIFAWQPIGVIEDRELTDLLKAGIDLKVEQSRSEFHLALLALGALWGIMIAKKDEAVIVLSYRPELIMFSCASVILVASCVFHFWYVNSIAYIYSLAGSIEGGKTIPDVVQSGIDSPFQFQFWSLLGGMIVAGLTLFSAHKLK